MKRWRTLLVIGSLLSFVLLLSIVIHDSGQEAENSRLRQEIRNRESERDPSDNTQPSGSAWPTTMPPDYVAPVDTDTHAGPFGLAVGDSAEKAGPILARGHLMDRIVLSSDRYAEIRVFPGEVVVRVEFLGNTIVDIQY